MSVALPDGAILSLATTYGAAKTISGISNASPGVATSAAHGFLANDIVEVTSGWGRLNNRIAKVGTVAANTFELTGIDTTSAQFYPTNGGAGSARAVTAWTQISQILEFGTSGGDQQFATFSFLENDFEQQLPTTTSAQSIQIGIGDDSTQPWFAALQAASDARSLRVLRVQLPTGAAIYFNCIVSFNPTPTLTKSNVMAVRASLAVQAKVTRY